VFLQLLYYRTESLLKRKGGKNAFQLEIYNVLGVGAGLRKLNATVYSEQLELSDVGRLINQGGVF
jgi:hypothetical protein